MTAPVLEVGAVLVSLTAPLVIRKESPRRVMLLLRVKEEKWKLTLFSVAETSQKEATKKSMKMKKRSMHMHVPISSPRINKKSID